MITKKELVAKTFDVLRKTTGGNNFPLPTNVEVREDMSCVAWNHIPSDVGMMAVITAGGDVMFALIGINTKAEPGTKRDEDGYNELILLDSSNMAIHIVYGYLAGFRVHSASCAWDQVPDEVEALPGLPKSLWDSKTEKPI